MSFNDGQDTADKPLTFARANYDKRARLLAIDDIAVHRLIICKMAAKAGFATFEADGCGDVVRLTTIGDFECATLDLSLGERTGAEVLHHFSICGFRAPIIIVSGSDTSITQYAFDLGISLGLNMMDPVVKPVDLSKLREHFRMIVSEWEKTRRLESAAT
jgi:CheY-like chemotaxis protein